MPSDAARTAELLAALPFAPHLGITLDEATADGVTGFLPWPARLCAVDGSFVVGQTEVHDDEGRLAGQTTRTQAVLAARRG